MPSRTPTAQRRRHVLDALERHGLTSAAAQAARQVGLTLREKTIQSGKEAGAFVHAETGAQLGGIVIGTATRLEVGPLLRIMAPEQRYACVHAHPKDDSFSPHDVALVLRYRAVAVVSAVGRHGGWYILSIDLDREPPSLERMLGAFNEGLEAATPGYAAQVQAGTMSRRDAQRAAKHAVWERIAPALGLRYDQV